MKAAAYVLGGVVAAIAFMGLSVLALRAAEWAFGPVWGLMVLSVALFAMGGGWVGWSIYRRQSTRRG